MSKIFVGNLSWNTNDDSLRSAFEKFGAIESAQVLTDRMTGRSRGFGFIKFENDEEAKKAVDEMNMQELDGRTIKVDIASGRPERPPRAEGSYSSNRSYDREDRYSSNNERGEFRGARSGGRDSYNSNRAPRESHGYGREERGEGGYGGRQSYGNNSRREDRDY